MPACALPCLLACCSELTLTLLLPSCLCSVLGAVLIVAGLYMVLWGKAREAQEKEEAAAVPTDEELGKESTAPAAAAVAAANGAAANGETK